MGCYLDVDPNYRQTDRKVSPTWHENLRCDMSDITAKIDEVTGHRRMRRYRKAQWMRSMVQENHLSAADLIWPIFLIDGENRCEAVDAMPGVERLSVDLAVKAAKEAHQLGIPALATFPNIDFAKRDKTGSEILNPDNLINEATRAIKAEVPEIGIITDVALDPFTSDGHDGIFENGEIANDKTVEVLARAAVLQAEAGADIIAPSEMMDGRIGVIRHALDDAGFQSVAIMSYATKFVSGFYGPYREAIGTSSFLKGDKNSYFLNPANPSEALRDAALDVEEGADMLMVKPGLPYLDMCLRVSEEFGLPTFAYQVSGEYAMIKAAGQNGWIDDERAMMESLMAFKRAGCSGILTYFALDAAKVLAR